MVKYLSIFFLLISTAGLAQSKKQDRERENFFRFGAKVGVNMNKISGSSYKNGFNYNFQGGAFVQFNFSNRFGIQPEINFVQSKSEFTSDGTDIYDDIFLNGSQKKATLNYLEIPVLLNINLGQSKKVKFQVGPSYGSLLKQKVDSLIANIHIYKNADWSVIGGLWIQLPLVNIGARYKIGVTDINAINDKQTWRTQAIQVFMGVTF